MRETSYLMGCLSEESHEVGQEAIKCQRFSPFHTGPGRAHSNIDSLALEMADLQAIVELLAERGVHIPTNSPAFQERVAEKKARTLHFMEVSRQLGCLE